MKVTPIDIDIQIKSSQTNQKLFQPTQSKPTIPTIIPFYNLMKTGNQSDNANL